MLLKSFHVRVFRNIIDSGIVEVDANTCIVGKNEAGKSSLIEGLHRLNPAKPTPLVILDDYPRWLKKEHEISGEIQKAVPITATYTFTPEEIKSLDETFGKGVLDKYELAASKKYVGDIQVSLPVNEKQFITQFRTTHIPGLIRDRLAKIDSVATLHGVLNEISVEKTTDDSEEATPEAQAAKQSKTALEKILDGADDLVSALVDYAKPLIPKTFMFSTYSQLEGRYSLPEVMLALANGSDNESIQAAADFLKLARINTSYIDKGDFEAANAELEAITSLLTKKVRQNWKQNQHLKLNVKLESVPKGAQPPERFLQFRVEDTRHDFTSRLDRRSTGFRWFVSFIASFFEFEADTNLILLLDEPGLSLHARAQMDLLNSIDTHLAVGRQVVYTTHSPFMVRTESLNRVRIVEDQGPEKGSTVTNEAGKTSDPDTLFPLQAALGYDIAQNLFIGNRNILVEGTSDFIYLNVLSSHLTAKGRPGLPENSRLLPAGGATNIPTFIALLGGKIEIVVLLDGDASRQRIDEAIAQGRLDKKRVLMIDSFCKVKGADIEDMFTPEEYLAMFNGEFGRSIKIGDLTGTDRIVKRIGRFEKKDFDHGRVAGYFIMHQNDLIPKLSTGTITNFEALIKAVSDALPTAVTPSA